MSEELKKVGQCHTVPSTDTKILIIAFLLNRVMKFRGIGEEGNLVCCLHPYLIWIEAEILTLFYPISSAGKVAEIKEGRAEVISNKGNTIGKNGTAEDPAVVIERSGVSEDRSIYIVYPYALFSSERQLRERPRSAS